MNLPACEIILKIAELRNLARTAAYFNYTPSRISQILKAAEEELGVFLFHRGKAGLIPTMECEALLPCLRSFLHAERCLQEQLDQVKNIQAGTIRIGSFTSISCHWLPQRLKAFGERYPRIQFELKLGDCGQIARWTRDGIIDIGLMTDPGADDLDFIPLLEDAFAAVLPQGHPLSGCDRVTYEQLRREQFIFLEPEDNWAMEEQLRRDGFYPQVRYRVKDDYTIMSLVENGLGLSILPRLVLNRAPYRLCAVELSPPWSESWGSSCGRTIPYPLSRSAWCPSVWMRR